MAIKEMPFEDLTEGQFFVAEDSTGRYRLYRLNHDGSAARYFRGDEEIVIEPEFPDIRLHHKLPVVPIDLSE